MLWALKFRLRDTFSTISTINLYGIKPENQQGYGILGFRTVIRRLSKDIYDILCAERRKTIIEAVANEGRKLARDGRRRCP